MHVYLGGFGHGRRSPYAWRQVEVQVERRTYRSEPIAGFAEREHSYNKFFYVYKDKRHDIDISYGIVNRDALTVADVARLENIRFANSRLAMERRNLTNYIAWCEQRIAEWKPDQPLLPVKPTGKTATLRAFQPEAR